MFSFKLMRVCRVLLLLTVCCYAAVSVGAQGLVGAPVDTHQQTGPVSIWASYDYDSARDVVRIATGVSVLFACLLGWYRSRKVSGKRLVTELVLLGLVPLVVHLGGFFFVNGLGGIGS